MGGSAEEIFANFNVVSVCAVSRHIHILTQPKLIGAFVYLSQDDVVLRRAAPRTLIP
jgi:hypothetical protein